MSFRLIPTALWHTPSFKNLQGEDQWLYFLLWTSPSRGYDCRITFLPRKLAKLARGKTPEALEESLHRLAESGWVTVDWDEQLVAVRPPETRLERWRTTFGLEPAFVGCDGTPTRATFTAGRREVFRRDAFTCFNCEIRPEEPPLAYDGRSTVWVQFPNGAWTELTLDHIVPESLGGPFTLDNLRTACRPCNVKRGARV